jgi:hypothetical protein
VWYLEQAAQNRQLQQLRGVVTGRARDIAAYEIRKSLPTVRRQPIRSATRRTAILLRLPSRNGDLRAPDMLYS